MRCSLRRNVLTLFAILGVLIALSGVSYAEVLIYEPFDYPAGDLSTQSSGVWSDSGSTLETGSLSYGSLPTAGNRVTMADDTSWFSTGSTLNGYLDNGDTLWFSVLTNTRVGTNPDFGFVLGTDRGNDSNNIPLQTTNGGDGLGFRVKGNNGGLIAASWEGGPVNNGTSTSVTAGETYLVVGEMIFGATDTINIYLPDTDLNLGSPVVTQTSILDQTEFDIITFMDKAASPRDQVDEIRFGTSYDDVIGVIPAVPEPSTFLLAGLGLMGLVWCGRRKRK